MQKIPSTSDLNAAVAAMDHLMVTVDRTSTKRREVIAKTEDIIAMLDGKFPKRAKKHRFIKLVLATKSLFKRNS